jgi:hypothetical protein
MATPIEHKRGDTFDRLLVMPAEFVDGYWLGWTVTAQLRTVRGKLISDFVTSWADPAATTRILRLFLADSETQAWPLGDQEFDAQFVRISDGWKRSTVTQIVTVLRDVTQP